MADGKYIQTVGRRKEATAQVRVYVSGTGNIQINGKDVKQYFPTEVELMKILSPLRAVGLEGKVDITVRAVGGGFTGQTEAVRLGIARALIKMNEDTRGALKPLGFLRRDARVKERKKFGFKSARRAPQWSKR